MLVAGGFTSGQPVQEAEYFLPWRGVFEPAPSNLTGRGGEVVIVGRLNATSKLMSTDGYASPTIVFGKGVSEAAESIAVVGAGWVPGEEVRIHVRRKPGKADGVETTAIADGSGRITAAARRDRDDPSGVLFVVARSVSSEAGARHSSRSAHLASR